jgi:heme ABC exporter ATP-binding subunit CcmA
MTPAAPALSARALTRRYDRHQALRKVSFDLAGGGLYGLAGDNGAGKSTLLKVLAGHLRPTEGEVLIHGEAVTPPLSLALRTRVGYLGHALFLYGDLSGRENLAFFLRLFGQPPERAEALLATVGLTDAADNLARTYSRGMQQRLALGRLLAQEADVWLLDEPTTGLDRRGLETLRTLLEGLLARGGTALIASHELDRMDGLLAATVRLRAGRLAEVA